MFDRIIVGFPDLILRAQIQHLPKGAAPAHRFLAGIKSLVFCVIFLAVSVGLVKALEGADQDVNQ